MVNFRNRTQLRVKLIILFFVVLMMISLPNHYLYAQSSNMKVSTVEMTVNIGAFSDADPKNSNTKYTRLSYVIKPENETFNLSEIVSRNYKPQFDGVFIINDDQLVTYGIILKRSRKFQITNNPIEDQAEFRLLTFGTGKFKYFGGLTVRAIWTKFEIDKFDPEESSQRGLYEKNANHKNPTYSYYLIKTIKNIKKF